MFIAKTFFYTNMLFSLSLKWIFLLEKKNWSYNTNLGCFNFGLFLLFKWYSKAHFTYKLNISFVICFHLSGFELNYDDSEAKIWAIIIICIESLKLITSMCTDCNTCQAAYLPVNYNRNLYNRTLKSME